MGITYSPPQSQGTTAATGKSSSETGVVTDGTAVIVVAQSLGASSTFEVNQAALTLVDGQPAPTGVDLLLITLDGAGGGTVQATILEGDGSTLFTNETGSPLESYTNSGSSSEPVAVVIDNGNFGAGAGSDQNMAARAVTDTA